VKRHMTIKALELFCGIGGFAAAVAEFDTRIVGALDQSTDALSVYRLNFPDHWARQVDLERVTGYELASYGADFWWLSPPCQPYCVRGAHRDLVDPRARSLSRIMDVMTGMPAEMLPAHLALENVEGFAHSQARERLIAMLSSKGYRIREFMLCPSEMGIPSRRPRYYLAASLSELNEYRSCSPRPMRPLAQYADPALYGDIPADLLVLPETVARFGNGIRILDVEDPASYTTCFTSGYGKSVVHAGSYLRSGAGVRRFSPGEIARLLHFPDSFSFPAEMSCRMKWRLLGNSLSVVAVREVLRAFPCLSVRNSPSNCTV
jgi:DNA (cytosine-5)-methyltransferase 1